jgi:hypothetical protein
VSDNTFCASRCGNYDCDRHATNVETGWVVHWRDFHHNCPVYIPFDRPYQQLGDREGD